MGHTVTQGMTVVVYTDNITLCKIPCMRKYSTEAERGKEPWGKVSIVYTYRACFNVMAVEINVLQQVGGGGGVCDLVFSRQMVLEFL